MVATGPNLRRGLLNTTNYKLPFRWNEFAFRINAPAKRELERNKRDNKPEQVKEQERRVIHVRHQTKRPAGQFQPGANREFQFHELHDLRPCVHSRFRDLDQNSGR
jgi:hypothetical protein